MKKLYAPSLLSLALLAVSAIARVVLPEKPSNILQDENSANDGTLRSQSGAGSPDNDAIMSCVPDQTQIWSCHVTTESTTSNKEVFSDDILCFTAGNTSVSNAFNSHDTTSDRF